MIIDLETHVWNDPGELGLDGSDFGERGDMAAWHSFAASSEAHEQATHCVDLSIVLGFRSELMGAHVPHESIASFVSKAPKRRIGFAGIDPMCGDSLSSINRAVSLGLAGVTISPAAQGYHPLDSRALRVYERCEELGLPLLVKPMNLRAAATRLEYARPVGFDEVARNFPRLRIVIGHLGFPWIDETLALIGKHRNVFADIAGAVARPWRLYNALLSAFECGVMDRLLFASNFPQTTPEAAIERVYSLNSYAHGTNLPSIPRQHLRNMVERDTLGLLGLERPGGGHAPRSVSRGAQWSGESTSSRGSSSLINKLSELMSGADAAAEE